MVEMIMWVLILPFVVVAFAVTLVFGLFFLVVPPIRKRHN